VNEPSFFNRDWGLISSLNHLTGTNNYDSYYLLIIIIHMENAELRLKEMIRKLKNGGHRITPQRLAIVKMLAESRDHPSVEEIYENIRKRFPTTSLATVYKTVSVLKSMQEVLEIEFSTENNRYDGNRPYPHPHMICIKCRKIVDPDLSALQSITDKLASETSFKVTSYRLDIQGVCPECQKADEKWARSRRPKKIKHTQEV
jgi:Fur family transcriptional regulator, peroxide stress response regulator